LKEFFFVISFFGLMIEVFIFLTKIHDMVVAFIAF